MPDGRHVEQALREYHTRYPARLLPGQRVGAMTYEADNDGRVLKVYVERDSSLPLVRTVAWKDTE